MTEFRRIPDKDGDFNSFLVSIHTFLNETDSAGVVNAERLGTTDVQLTLFNDEYDLWAANWLLHENPDTQTETVNLKKDKLRTGLEVKIREIQNKAEVSDALTDQDRVILRIPARDDTHTRIEAPSVSPGLSIEKREHLQLVIRIHNPEDPDTSAKPPGVESTEIYQFIGDNPPPQTEWLHAGGTGRFLFTITYIEYNLKKTAHIVARYRNARGEFGPWSDALEVDIS